MVPGLDADALVDAVALPLPAGARSPTTRARRRERAAAAAASPSTSCSTPACFDDDRYWDVAVDYAKAAPDDICMRVTVAQRGPGRRDAARAADAVVPQHLVLGRRRRGAAADPPSDDGALRRRATPTLGTIVARAASGTPEAAVLRERDQRTRGCGERRARRHRTRRTASTTTSSPARPTRQPEPTGTKAALWYQLDGRGRRDDRDAAAAARRRRATLGDGFDEVVARTRAAEADDVLRRARARGRPTTSARSCARRSPACSGASSTTTTTSSAGSTATRRSPPPPPERAAGPQRRLAAHRQRATSSRCPTSGSTRGSRPGTWPSTASRWRTSTPSSPRSSCVLLTREWYMHPNGQLPAYEWDFGDVNPPVHALGRAAVFRIDGATRPRVARADLPQAAARTSPGGSTVKDAEATNLLRRRLPRHGQHRPVRPLGAAARRALARAGRRHRLDGDLLPERCSRWRSCSPSEDPAYEDIGDQVLRALRLDRARRSTSSGLWDEEDGFYYDRVAHPRRDASRCGCAR